MSARAVRIVIGICLFGSGIAGLVYEVVWSRHVTELVGASSSAQVLVISTYMGGLALGSWLFGSLADRVKRPEKLYATLEIAIGAYGLVFPWVVKAVGVPFIALAKGSYPENLGTVTVLRLALAVAVLLPPTTLMGGTLPAAARFLIGRDASVRRTVGRLYFLNSLGASLGAALAAFALLPNLGLHPSAVVAASLNVGAALLALLVARGPELPPPAADPGEPPLEKRSARLALIAVTTSGFAALALEVAWIRLLALILGSSAQAFAVMLSAFILGIALGSGLVARPTLRAMDPLRLLAALLAAGVAALALTLPFAERIVFVFARLAGVFPPTETGYVGYQAGMYAGCLALMLIPTLCMGAALPVAARAASRGAASAGRYVGITYAVNTMGTLFGAIAANWLMPALTLRGLFIASLLVDLAAAFIALAGATRPLSRRTVLGVAGAVACVAIAIGAGPWRNSIITGGVFRERGRIGKSWDAFVTTLSEWKELYAVDGSNATVTVGERGNTIALFVNGKADASTGIDMGTQAFCGHIPLILKPDAKRVLVVGLGSGVTSGAAASHEQVEVETVELLPEVRDASRFFDPWNDHVLANPRHRLTVDDAKTYVKLASHKYDVIISEPSNPWMAGIAGLFSDEFWSDADRALADDGLLLAWMHTYEITDEMVSLVARTISRRFPYVYGFLPIGEDVLFIASRKPIARDYAAMEKALTPSVKANLARSGLPISLPGILALQAISPVTMRSFPGDGPINTDAKPILEYRAPYGFFAHADSSVIDMVDERRSGDGVQLLVRGLPDAPLAVSRAVHRPDWAAERRKQAAELEAEIAAGKRDKGEERAVVDLLAEALDDERDVFSPAPDYSDLLRRVNAIATSPDATPPDLAVEANILLRSGKPGDALRGFEAALARARPGDPRGAWLAGKSRALSELGRLPDARAALDEALAAGAPLLSQSRARAALALATAAKDRVVE